MKKFEHIYVAKELAPSSILEGTSFTPSPEHLEMINNYTLEPVEAEQVIALPIKAMNDQIDRDYDRFSEFTINNLASDKSQTSPLGKPFIVSHDRKDLANGRVYLAEKEVEEGINHLKLWAYVPNTPQHQEFLENVMFGIYWAVSVGVLLESANCSICGAPMYSYMFSSRSECENDHMAGEKYEGNLCYRNLSVKELYEVSSVYLGAQYGAEIARKMVGNKDRTLYVIKQAIKEVNEKEDNPSSNIWSDMDVDEIEDKAVVSYKKFPLADEGMAWSFSASDGDALLGSNSDWNRFKSVHTHFDPENKETKAGYKLPHHKIIDGSIKTVWRGVSAAGNALMGARGGVSIPSADVGGCKGHLKKHYSEFKKSPPWENEKVVTLVEEGAELESMDDGSLKIMKGTKVWIYDGTKIVRSEVKRVKEEIERLNKELADKAEEVESLDASLKEVKDNLDEAKELNRTMVKELEEIKAELETKDKIVESYLGGLKDEVKKFYMLSKGIAEDEVDTTFVVKLLDKCGDDPDLLAELRDDFKERAKAVMPPEMLRSSIEDGAGIEDKQEIDETDEDGLANDIHA